MRFLVGIASGLVCGYTAIRAADAVRELRSPAVPLEHDARRYGATRRALMVAGLVRSIAGSAAAAYALGPLVEPAPGEPEPRPRRLALVAASLVASTLLDLPGDFVEGFALERRYGLSKQSARDWLAQRAKGLGVAVAISVPLVELLGAATRRAPATWPWLATAGSLPLLVLANVLAPTYIAPLFNTFTPIEGGLAPRIRELAGRYGAGDAKLLTMDMSRQTEKANAYVTGVLGTKRIVVGDTLLGSFEPDETMFVVAHELGHYVAGDVWRAVALGVAASAAIFNGARAIAGRPGRELGTAAGLARLSFAISLASALAGPPLAAFSRARERAADRFAVAATGDGESGAAAFERLRDRNLAEDEQPRWMELLFASHPSLRSRIERLRAAA